LPNHHGLIRKPERRVYDACAMKDFWLSCGHHLLDRNENGELPVSDEFLKAYLARPELTPMHDACAAERTLHAALLADPRRPVSLAEIGAVADPDARENWELMIAFRNRLLAQGTLEGAYRDLVRSGPGNTPPLFIDHLAQIILRNVLDGCDDPFVLRAAELFFRPQRLTLHGGSLIAADEETIAHMRAAPISPLVAMLGLPHGHDIDVLNEDNAQAYWERSDRFDMGLNLTSGGRGHNALAEVIRRWMAHLLSLDAAVEPIGQAINVALAWYVGLDAEGTAIGDALWNGQELDRGLRERIVGLYRVLLRGNASVLDNAKGEPIYLIMAMTPEWSLRLKPQNLITGLPIVHLQPSS
jgi:hypothetical protein